MIDQQKLQQLHARLAEEQRRFATTDDLRDLVACLLSDPAPSPSESTREEVDDYREMVMKRIVPVEQPPPATDVDAAVTRLQELAEDCSFDPSTVDNVVTVLGELARLRAIVAEAKPEPAKGREVCQHCGKVSS